MNKTRHLTHILPFLKVIVNAQQQFPELVRKKLNLDAQQTEMCAHNDNFREGCRASLPSLYYKQILKRHL